MDGRNLLWSADVQYDVVADFSLMFGSFFDFLRQELLSLLPATPTGSGWCLLYYCQSFYKFRQARLIMAMLP